MPRGSAPAASGGLAEHLAARASSSNPIGTSAPRAALPGSRALTPAQRLHIQKREQKQVAIAAGSTVDKAMAYFDRFDTLCASGAITTENKQRTLTAAFRCAKEGVAALDGLTEFQRAGDDGRKAFVNLYQKRAALACSLTKDLRDVDFERGSALSQRMEEARSGPVDLPALDGELNAYLEQVDHAVEAMQPYFRATSEAIEKLGNQAHLNAFPGLLGVLKEAMHTLTALRLAAFEMHRERIWLLGNRMVVAEDMSSTEIVREVVALLTCAVNLSDRDAIDLLQDARIPQQASMVSRMDNGASILQEHAGEFIVLASRHFDSETDASHVDAIGFATRFAACIGALAQECDAVLKAPKVPFAVAQRLEGATYLGAPTWQETPVQPATGPEGASGEDDLAAMPSAPPQAHASTGKARRARPRPKARQAGGESPTAPALQVRQAVVLELAQERLKAFRAPEPGRLRAPADVLALGESLRKDTSTIAAAMQARNDPLSVMREVRQTLDGWFGDLGQWRARRAQLAEVGASHLKPVADTLEAMDERIAQLDALHQAIHPMGIDLIKTFASPQLKHVLRLLEWDAAAGAQTLRIGTPRQLRSQGDPDRRHGTLFEVELDTGTLSDGQPAPPLYVHLHTKTPITAKACRTVAFEDLDAFHVKTADQRAKGRTWELLNNALHSVHRGPLDADLLRQLQRRMAPH